MLGLAIFIFSQITDLIYSFIPKEDNHDRNTTSANSRKRDTTNKK